MTDIATRLRELIDPDDPNLWKVDKDRREAADEIERLTEQVKLDTVEFKRLNTDIVKRARKAIEAADEIDRLRTALWHAREDLAHLVQQIDAALNIQQPTGNRDD